MDVVSFSDSKGLSILSPAYGSPIRGFRPPGPRPWRSKAALPEFYPSSEHFYQSEKFRGVNERLRHLVMSQPTAREAYKQASRLSGNIREDWTDVRESVIRCALRLRLMQDREFRKALSVTRGAPLLYVRQSELYLGTSGSRGDNTVGTVLQELYKEIAERQAVRVLVCGSRNLRDDAFVRLKLDHFFQNKRPSELICPGEPGADSIGEAWARDQYVPVRYLPIRGTRRGDAREPTTILAKYATHVVAVLTHTSPHLIELLKKCRANGATVRVVNTIPT